jgi:thiol-disulfide isomerase/thioredoxin
MKRLLIVWLLSVAPVMAAMAEAKLVFSLPDTRGEIHTLSQYAGKWVVVNYWATSCPPCIKEIPQLEAFHQRHKNHDAVVLGVDFEDISPAWLKDFMDSMSMSYPVLRSDMSQQVTPFGVIMMLPTTFIISPAGELVARQAGAVTAADLEAFIKRQNEAGKANAPATKLNTKIH